MTDGVLFVGAPDQFAADWNESKHAPLLSSYAPVALGHLDRRQEMVAEEHRLGGFGKVRSASIEDSPTACSFVLLSSLVNPLNVYALSWRSEDQEGNLGLGGEFALPARAQIGRLTQEAPDGPESLIEPAPGLNAFLISGPLG